MKYVGYFLMGLILFFFGCSNNNPVPKDIIPEDSLIRIIVDMHLADAILIEPSVQQKQMVINKSKFYNAVLNKHAVTKDKFQESLNYYSDNLEKFDSIYERVIEELTVIQGTLIATDSLKTKPVHK